MLTYDSLKDRPRELLAATGLTHEEFARLIPAFTTAYADLYPPDKTHTGKPRQRRAGAGAKGSLAQMTDKLLFILVYQKTQALQTMHGLQFGLSQPQTNYWIHHLLPVLQRALAALGHAPERDTSRVADSPLAVEGTPALAIDGTERRRQRPQDPVRQKAHYSGKKKAHTDKNLLLVNEATSKVVYLGPTLPGKMHDKRAADEAPMAYPPHATLDKDTGFQGYEPPGVLTRQCVVLCAGQLGGHKEWRAPARVHGIEEEFLEAMVGRCSQEKMRQAVAQGLSDDGFGGRVVRVHGAQPTLELCPDVRSMRQGQVLKQTLGDAAELNVAVVGGELAAHPVTVSLVGAVQVLVA